MIPTNNPMLATLFGAPMQTSSPLFAARGGMPAEKQSDATVNGAPPAMTSGITVRDENGVVTGPEAETRIRGNQASVERALEAEARAADKHAADLERGYRKRMDADLKAKHAMSFGRQAGEANFSSRETAMEAATSYAGRTQRIVSQQGSDHDYIAMMTERLADPAAWNMEADNIEMRIARTQDRLEAERLNIDIQASYMRASFDMTEPTFHEAADGTLSHAAYEVRHSTYGLLVSVDENGTMTKYGPDGEPEVPMGQRLDRSV